MTRNAKKEKVKPEMMSITSLQSLPSLHSTHPMFRLASDNAISPIDEFLKNTNEINKLYSDYISGAKPLPKELASIVLLGYMSATESFIRRILRELMLIDEHMAKLAETFPLTYGAALHHEARLLPEATMEDISFSGKIGFEDGIRRIAGIKSNYPTEIKAVIEGYERICEIRHCCVHRFGKLGSKNAAKLGLGDHSKQLEQYFAPDVNELQTILDALRTCAKTLNNYLCQEILQRTCRQSTEASPVFRTWDWSWDLRVDKSRFKKYYDVFSSTLDTPPSPTLRDFYKSFVKSHKPLPQIMKAKK